MNDQLKSIELFIDLILGTFFYLWRVELRWFGKLDFLLFYEIICLVLVTFNKMIDLLRNSHYICSNIDNWN